jgi:hypothetical protein
MTSRIRHPVLAVVALFLVACTTPELLPDEPEPGEAPIARTVPDPTVVAMGEAFEDLVATVTEAHDRLARAVEATAVGPARAAAQDALAQLVVDPPVSGGAAPVGHPLFPSVTLERGELEDAEDQLTITATAARDAGTQGGQVLAVLRDPVAGDLGSWQRDPEGVLLAVAEAIRARNLDQLDHDVMELPGIGTRAIAWAQLAAGAGDRQVGPE